MIACWFWNLMILVFLYVFSMNLWAAYLASHHRAVIHAKLPPWPWSQNWFISWLVSSSTNLQPYFYGRNPWSPVDFQGICFRNFHEKSLSLRNLEKNMGFSHHFPFFASFCPKHPPGNDWENAFRLRPSSWSTGLGLRSGQGGGDHRRGCSGSRWWNNSNLEMLNDVFTLEISWWCLMLLTFCWQWVWMMLNWELSIIPSWWSWNVRLLDYWKSVRHDHHFSAMWSFWSHCSVCNFLLLLSCNML